MSNPIGSTGGTPSSQPSSKNTQQAPVRVNEPKQEPDSFMRTPPTAKQLESMRAAIAALDGLPPAPKGADAQKAWLAQVQPLHEAADRAQRGLGSASFFHKSVSVTEADAAGDKTHALGAQIRDVEEQLGLREPVAPASPTRPLFGTSKAVSGWMGNNAFTALLGLFALPVTAVIDVADAVSRPKQALDFPGAQKEYETRKKRFDAEQSKKTPAK